MRKKLDLAYTHKLNQYISLIPSISYHDIDLATGSFIAKQASFQLLTNLSTRLTTSTFLQWNNKSDEMNASFRLHYIPKIGSDIYSV